MNRLEIIRQLQALEPRFKRVGVVRLSIFGSRARQDNLQNSDLDLLLEVDPDSRFSLLDLVGLEATVTDRLGVTANAFMKRSLNRDFQASIEPDIQAVF